MLDYVKSRRFRYLGQQQQQVSSVSSQQRGQRSPLPLDVGPKNARIQYDRIRRMIMDHHNKHDNQDGLFLLGNNYPMASLRHAYDFLLSTAARNVAVQRHEDPMIRLDLAKTLLHHVLFHHHLTTTTTTTDPITQFFLTNNKNNNNNTPDANMYGFGRLICQYLEPFRSTAKALYLTGEYTTTTRSSLTDQAHALQQASQVAEWMQDLLLFGRNNKSELLVPNVEYYVLWGTLWSRRCRFLATNNLRNVFASTSSSTTSLSSDDAADQPQPFVRSRRTQHHQQQPALELSLQELVDKGLGGARTPQECLERLRLCLEEMGRVGLSADNERVRIHELTCLASCGVTGASEQALQVFERIHGQATKRFIPTLVGTVLSSFANELPLSSDQQALFGKAVKFFKSIQEKHTEYTFDPIAYSIIMRMASLVGDAQQTEMWLEEMERLNIRPYTIHYNIALTALTNSSDIPNVHRMEEIFRNMEAMAQAGRDTAPDKFTCATLIKGLLRSYEPEERALAVLTMMEESTDGRLHADSPVYTEYMNGLKERFSRAQELPVKETIAIQMERMLRRMHDRSRVDRALAGPDRYHFNSCLDTWSRSYSKLAPDRVKQLFADFCAPEASVVRPDGHTFRLMIKALAIGSNHEIVNYTKGLLDRMKQEGLAEHIGVFNQYVHMLVKCRDIDAMEKAEQFVLQMEDDYQNGTSVVRPNGATYSIVLRGYSKQGGRENQAELWFARMLQLQDDRERADFEVTPDSYASMITVWARSKQRQYALKRVQALFTQAKSAGPLTYHLYTAYQDAWSRLGERNAPLQLEKILKEMQRNYESGDNPHCRPNANNFSILISAWGAAGNVERAEGILSHLEQLARSSISYKHLKPTIGCYRGVIQACMNSSNNDRTSHVVRILDRMKDGGGPSPDESCYIYAIVAVANDGGPQAAHRAQLLLQRMNDERVKRSNKTYAALFRACAATAGPPRVEADAFETSKSILLDCYKRVGQPSEDVLRDFERAAEKLLPENQSLGTQIQDALSEITKRASKLGLL